MATAIPFHVLPLRQLLIHQITMTTPSSIFSHLSLSQNNLKSLPLYSALLLHLPHLSIYLSISSLSLSIVHARSLSLTSLSLTRLSPSPSLSLEALSALSPLSPLSSHALSLSPWSLSLSLFSLSRASLSPLSSLSPAALSPCSSLSLSHALSLPLSLSPISPPSSLSLSLSALQFSANSLPGLLNYSLTVWS